MEKVEENRGNGYLSRDLLVNGKRSFEFSDENEDEIELSLGLSLNGKFGVDPKRDSSNNKKLKRSSSSSVTNLNGNNYYYEFKFPFDATCQLVRTCSLPVETEEEWRRRKELESFRRFEAKRKRLEEMKSSNSSQGSGSSGISDFESQPTQGPNDSSNKARASPCGQSTEHDPKSIAPATARAPETTNEKPPVVPGAIGKEAKEMLKNFMENMPCVSTKGNGPNGKKIEGFLYGYKKGEEVRIVCVCHGSFLSPAEFVKHGGGGDVDHPLRHIVINPSPML